MKHPMPSVLIAGERFGRTRDAFRREGADAWSCDKVASEEPGPHLKMDWRKAIVSRRWDFILIHFVCTEACVSGNHKYAEGKPGWELRLQACRQVDWDMELVKAHSRFWCAENPVNVWPTLTKMGPKTQAIQPHEYGHDASKTTWLWHNLPKLVATHNVAPRWVCCNLTLPSKMAVCPACAGDGKRLPRWENQTNSGQNRLAPDRAGNEGARAAERGATYAGWSEAMAAQWLPIIRGT